MASNRQVQNEPCSEYVDIGPFRFECEGHLEGAARRAVKHHDGVLAHFARSPGQPGDVDVMFYTAVTDEDEE